MIYYATIFFTEELFCTNKILYVLKPVSEMCSRYFTKSHDNVSLVLFHFTSMKFTSITRMPVRSFLSFSDFRTYASGLFSNQSKWCILWAPFPSLWRHQMKCLLISERIFFFKTWLKHTNNQRMLNGQYTPQWTVVCKKYTNYFIVTKIQLQKCILLMFDG